MQDLKKDFPELGRGLQELLDMEGDVENIVCCNFEVEYDYYGETRQHPLKEGGSQIPVTRANRKEFVKLYTKWLLEDSIEVQFKAFADGFFEVSFTCICAMSCTPTHSCNLFSDYESSTESGGGL